MAKLDTNVRGNVVASERKLPGRSDALLPVIKSLDGVIGSNRAIAQEVKNVAAEIKIQNERMARMYSAPASAMQGLSQQDLVNAIQEGILSTAAAIVTEANKVLDQKEGRGPLKVEVVSPVDVKVPDSPGGMPGRTPPPGPYDQAPSWARGDRLDRSGDGGAPAGAWSSFEEGRAAGMKGIRNSIGRRIQQSAGRHYERWAADTPRWTEGGEESFSPGLSALNLDPTALRTMNAAADRFALKGKAIDLAGRFGQGFTQGGMRQGIGAMMPAGAMKLAGGVGMAYAAVNQGLDMMESQRAQNMAFQSVLGGSNAEGFGERAKQSMFRLGLRGTMSGEEANRLYMGVLQTGMRGEQRGNAEDFAVGLYKDLGMGVTESLALISEAAESGNESLTGLRDALVGVTESARDAGVNAEVARKTFSNYYAAASGVMTPGNDVAIASALTQAQTQMGRSFQGVDASGMMNRSNINIMAAQAGMSEADFMYGGAQMQATSMQQNVQQVGQSFLGDRGQQIIARMKAQFGLGPNEAPTEEQNRQIAEAVATEMNISPTAVQSLLAARGVQTTDPLQAMGMLVGAQTGSYDISSKTKDQIAKGQTKTINRGRIADRAKKNSPYGVMGGTAAQIEAEMVKAGKGKSVNNRIQEEFAEDVAKTGRRGGISEMIAAGEMGGAATKLEVQTKDGPRVVTITDAMLEFRDQVDAGTAIVAEGSKAGVTIAEALGTEGDKGVKVKSDTKRSDKGKSMDDWDGGDNGGTVRVIPSPELAKWLNFIPSGTTGGGTVPGPAHTPTGSRPSGR